MTRCCNQARGREHVPQPVGQGRSGTSCESVVVAPEDVKFEAVDPPQPGEDEGERIEQILGFERSPERSRSEDGDGFADDDGDYGMSDDGPQSITPPAAAPAAAAAPTAAATPAAEVEK